MIFEQLNWFISVLKFKALQETNILSPCLIHCVNNIRLHCCFLSLMKIKGFWHYIAVTELNNCVIVARNMLLQCCWIIVPPALFWGAFTELKQATLHYVALLVHYGRDNFASYWSTIATLILLLQHSSASKHLNNSNMYFNLLTTETYLENHVNKIQYNSCIYKLFKIV